MKIPSIILLTFLLWSKAHSEEVCRFRNVNIPRHEARLLELARIIEFRCEFQLPKLNGTSQIIVERYQEGKCVSRQQISTAMYDDRSESFYEGILSFGWHLEDQKLVAVPDTGYFHQSGSVQLPGFHSTRPVVWSFFKNAKPDPRTSNNGNQFDLYPVIGIRGSKNRVINGLTLSGQTGDIASLPSEKLIDVFRRAPDAIIVYLSFGTGYADVDFNSKTE